MSKIESGVFVNSLKRNNKEIKQDRAESILKEAKMIYKRRIENIEMELDKKTIEQNNLLDMSPDNAQSLISAKNFDASTFSEADMKLGMDMFWGQNALNVAKERYEYLFGSD